MALGSCKWFGFCISVYSLELDTIMALFGKVKKKLVEKVRARKGKWRRGEGIEGIMVGV